MSKLYNGMIDEDVIGVIANYIGVMNYDKDYIGTFIYGYMEDNERCIDVISLTDSDDFGNIAFNKIGDTNIIYRSFPKDYLGCATDLAVCDVLYDKTGLIKAYKKQYIRENYCCYNKDQIIFDNSFLYHLKENVDDTTFMPRTSKQRRLKKNLLLTNFYEYLLEHNGGIGCRCSVAMKDDADRIDRRLNPFSNVSEDESAFSLAAACYRRDNKLSKVQTVCNYQKKMIK